MEFIYLHDFGTDNGKTFTDPQEALKYFAESLKHAKIHENATYVKHEIVYDRITVTLRIDVWMLGERDVEYTIRISTPEDAEIIKKYHEINS